MGLIHATLGEHELAVEQFIAATSLDQYLAVAWVVLQLLVCCYTDRMRHGSTSLHIFRIWSYFIILLVFFCPVPSPFHTSPLRLLANSAQSSVQNRYFQCGVSNFLLGRYELALKDFDEALLYLRGNQAMWVIIFFLRSVQRLSLRYPVSCCCFYFCAVVSGCRSVDWGPIAAIFVVIFHFHLPAKRLLNYNLRL